MNYQSSIPLSGDQPEVLKRIETDVKRALGLPVREETAETAPAEQKKAAAATGDKK